MDLVQLNFVWYTTVYNYTISIQFSFCFCVPLVKVTTSPGDNRELVWRNWLWSVNTDFIILFLDIIYPPRNRFISLLPRWQTVRISALAHNKLVQLFSGVRDAELRIILQCHNKPLVCEKCEEEKRITKGM